MAVGVRRSDRLISSMRFERRLSLFCRLQTVATSSLTPATRNLLLITIDTLRADRVGAYGYRSARTPAIDTLAARGARFDSAFSSAPITLTSHATIMTGRYPPGHGARHNGMRLDPAVPTIADALRQAGFATAAFVAAFPLDRRFGLTKGFQTYSDRMPRGPQGRLASERPGHVVADEAIAWLDEHRAGSFFLWVHLFEPHAPYGDPSDHRPVGERYDDEVAEGTSGGATRRSARKGRTLIAVAGDHGEAFSGTAKPVTAFSSTHHPACAAADRAGNRVSRPRRRRTRRSRADAARSTRPDCSTRTEST